MGKVLAIANQKGGVGKTTTTVNLGAALAEMGHRVLIIDMDPQGNTSATFGLDLESLRCTIADLLIHDEIDSAHAIFQRDNLCLIPSNLALEAVALTLHTVRLRETRLSRRVEALYEEFEYILIDCPPSIGLLTENALAAAEHVIIPVDMGYYSLVGVTQILGAIEDIHDGLNPRLGLGGFVATKVMDSVVFSQAVVDKLQQHFGDRVFRTGVRFCERLLEAPSHGMTIFDYAPESIGALDYYHLAEEICLWNPATQPAQVVRMPSENWGRASG